MKIIDNPILGIGLLLCVGLAVLGLSLMTSAEGQNLESVIFSSDEGVVEVFVPQQQRRQVTSMTTVDFDESPFIERSMESARVRQATRAQAAASEATPQESRQSSVRVTTQVQNTRPGVEVQISDDPFTPAVSARVQVATQTPDSQPQVVIRRAEVQSQQQQQAANARVAQQGQPATRPQATNARPTQQIPNRAEKRDELMLRIVKMRLDRGEYEQLAPVVLQMQNPEKAIEVILDFAEKSDDENISKLLDVATIVTLQLGQPRPPAMPTPNMPMTYPGNMPMTYPGMPQPGMPQPGAMPGVSFGMGMQGTMPGGMPMGAMPPGAMGGGMSGGMPGMSPVPPGQPAPPGPQPGPGGGIFPTIMPPGQPGQAILWDGIMPGPNPPKR